MVKFAHISDCHLGGWRQQQMQELNLQSFKMAIDTCIKEKVEFVLFSGDLFDSAYPSIEILKEVFSEFKKLKEAKIHCFIIAGSHDYSVSGKTFLDVLEKAGFCKNVTNFEIREDSIILNPVVYGNIAIYGYPGKKSSLEIDDLKNLKIQDSPGLFKILMLHTTIDSVKGTLPVDSVPESSLPKADYYAMGHVHVDFQYEKFVYPGPTFPNNFQELADLKHGSFYIVSIDKYNAFELKKIELKIRDIEYIEIEIDNASTGFEKILTELNKRELKDKVILLKIKGELKEGKTSDIKFQEIEQIVANKGAYCFLRNTSALKSKEFGMEIEVKGSDMQELEEQIIKNYSEENPSEFNKLIKKLMSSLNLEKQEDEKSLVFETRLLESTKKIIDF